MIWGDYVLTLSTLVYHNDHLTISTQTRQIKTELPLQNSGYSGYLAVGTHVKYADLPLRNI